MMLVRFWLVGVGMAMLICTGATSNAAGRALSVADFQVTKWTDKDGAPTNTWVMAQTDDGWLWFGGPNGLFRFDGVRFEPMKLDAEAKAPSTAVSALYALPGGGLVVGTPSGGIYIVKHGKTMPYDTEATRRAGRMGDFIQDSQGILWAAGFSGVLRFDGNAWQPVSSDWGLEIGEPLGLIVDSRGTLWFTGPDRVQFLERGSHQFQLSASKPPEYPSFLKSPDGRTWLGGATDGQALQLLSNAASATNGDGANRLRSSYTMFFDRDGNFWRTGGDDSSRWHVRAIKGIDSIDKNLTTGLQDFDGGIWFASGGAVIYRLRRASIVKSLDKSSAQAVVVGGDSGKAWVGLSNSYEAADDGLWMFDESAHRIEPTKVKQVTALARAPDGTIWAAGNDERLLRIEGDRVQPMALLPESARGPRVKGIAPDCAGGLWVSVAPTLLRLAGDEWQPNGGVAGLPAVLPEVQVCDGARNLWLGYADGKVFRVAGNEARMFGVAEGLDLGAVTAINIGARYVVVGGERGLAILQANRFMPINGSDSRVLDRPTAIVETAGGDIWTNSSRGLARIGGPEIDRWRAANGTALVAIEQFDTSDGYPGPGFSIPASRPTAAMASDGRIWFATMAGVAWIDQAQVRRSVGKPPLFIHALAAGADRFDPEQGVSLAKGTRNIQVDYTALSYSHPERLRFRYKLDGIDQQWVDAGARRQASYSNLGPGDYRFRVDVTDEFGMWTDSDTTLAFVIPPTFVQSRAFLALCIVAALSLLAALYRLRVRQLTQRERLLVENRMQERERIARELHDTLLQGTQALVMKVHAATHVLPADSPARQMLDEVLDNADAVIVEGRDRIQDLRAAEPARQDLAQQLGQVGSNAASGGPTEFRLVVSGTDRTLAADVSNATYYIGRESMLNAFRHARASLVEVEIVYGDDFFRLLVRDDGIGMQQPAAAADKNRRHWGLAGMHERALGVGAELELSSGSGAGTELQLKIAAAVAYQEPIVRSRWRFWRGRPARPAPQH